MNENALNLHKQLKGKLEVKNRINVVATGRSDYSNQINNVLAFLRVFRGVLDTRAWKINEEMKIDSHLEKKGKTKNE